ncbi:hypothetical protein ACRC6Q_16675 [Planococcus sp. SE5232]|uniref:hypothetical protein n=1 Tax=unclassified Planococcus (in: firmicutes) TaxID=2662419 RepID=UPI003D6B21FF
MDINNVMNNMMHTRAKQEMRSNEWGKKLDDVLTSIEELVEVADEKQAMQMKRLSGEIKRVAEFRLRQLEDDELDEDFREEEEE